MEPSIQRVSERMRVRPTRERERRATDGGGRPLRPFRVDRDERDGRDERSPARADDRSRKQGHPPVGSKPADESGSHVDVVA